jgi:hypothetical protein
MHGERIKKNNNNIVLFHNIILLCLTDTFYPLEEIKNAYTLIVK